MEEAIKREPARAEFARQVEEYKNMVKSTEEKYSHILDEERNKVREELTKAETWLYDQLALQADLPMHKDPVLTVAAMKEKQNALAHVSPTACSSLATSLRTQSMTHFLLVVLYRICDTYRRCSL